MSRVLDIDVKKLRAAMKDHNPEHLGRKYCDWPEYSTILYSIRAHSHGRLHVTKRWVANNQADGHQILVEKTMEDQAKLIEKYWELFKWKGKVDPEASIHVQETVARSAKSVKVPLPEEKKTIGQKILGIFK